MNKKYQTQIDGIVVKPRHSEANDDEEKVEGSVSDGNSMEPKEQSRSMSDGATTTDADVRNQSGRVKKKWTQEAEDNAIFTSDEFINHLNSQENIIIRHHKWQVDRVKTLKEQNTHLVGEIHRLRLVVDDANKNIGKLQQDLLKSQNDALAAIDRFQPITDGQVSELVANLSRRAEAFVKSVDKDGYISTNEEWISTAGTMVYPGSFEVPYEIGRGNHRNVRKLMLRNIVWHFLVKYIFQFRFGGYPASISEGIEAFAGPLYSALGESIHQGD